MEVQAGTALGEAEEVRWDTIQLHRWDMLLMVATSHHQEMCALPDSKGGLHGAPFNLWSPTRHRHHQPNTTHMIPCHHREALAVAGDLSSWAYPSVDQVLWVGKGPVARVGLWEGGAAQALFADAPEAFQAGSPSCPYHPTLLSRCAPATDPAVMEIAEHSVLFLWGRCTRSRSARGTTSMRNPRSTSPSGALPPAVRPTTLWHLLSTNRAWRLLRCSKAGAWSLICPCDCKACLLVWLLALLPNWTKLT